MRTFSARETLWLRQLDGIELAGFGRRAFAFMIDWALVSLILAIAIAIVGLAYVGVNRLLGRPASELNLTTSYSSITLANDKPATSSTPKKHFDYHVGMPSETADPNESTAHKVAREIAHIVFDLLLPILYFGIFLWKGNGRTPGKRLMKIRVVSLVHTHITFWHAIERALGYGAAALEGGFGFIQFFLHPYRRCAQDRLAETIVVTELSYQKKFLTRNRSSVEADTLLQSSDL